MTLFNFWMFWILAIFQGDRTGFESLQIEIVRAKYIMEIRKENKNPQSNMFLPELELKVQYEIVSDGVRSYIHLSVLGVADEDELKISGNDIFAYTDCKINYGLILTELNEILEVIALKTYKFNITGEFRKKINNEWLEVQNYQIEGLEGVILQGSRMLPKQINIGNCMLIESATIGIKGFHENSEIEMELVEFENVNFDFKLYEHLLQEVKGCDTARRTDLLWN